MNTDKKIVDVNGIALRIGCSVQAVETINYYPRKVRKGDVYTISRFTAGGGLNLKEMNNDSWIFEPYEFQLF